MSVNSRKLLVTFTGGLGSFRAPWQTMAFNNETIGNAVDRDENLNGEKGEKEAGLATVLQFPPMAMATPVPAIRVITIETPAFLKAEGKKSPSSLAVSNPVVSKDVLDTLNSLAWFFMDACWMAGFPTIAKAMAPFVLLTGIWLTMIEKRLQVVLINLAIVSWILMNVAWMFSEMKEFQHAKTYFLLSSKIFLVGGLLHVALAVAFSKNVKETFSHFRRFRLRRDL